MASWMFRYVRCGVLVVMLAGWVFMSGGDCEEAKEKTDQVKHQTQEASDSWANWVQDKISEAFRFKNEKARDSVDSLADKGQQATSGVKENGGGNGAEMATEAMDKGGEAKKIDEASAAGGQQQQHLYPEDKEL